MSGSIENREPATPVLKDAVMAVVRNGPRVLVIRRGKGVPRPGYWTPVSGGLEPGEDQRDAVMREVREEVGLDVAPLGKVWECLTDDGRYRLHWWLADYRHGQLRPDPREVGAARWIDPGEFASLSPTFADDRRFFADILPGL